MNIKNIFLILTFIFLSVTCKSQNNMEMQNQSDTLTWYIFNGGKPNGRILLAQLKVAKDWGVKTEVHDGECNGDPAHKLEEFEKKNIPVFQFFKTKYGDNWKELYDKAVEEEIKKK